MTEEIGQNLYVERGKGEVERIRHEQRYGNVGGAEERWRAVSRSKLLTNCWNRMRKWCRRPGELLP